MAYLINGTDLATFGIIPGIAPGSNIALSGHLDFPVRLNKTSQPWADQGGIEPYVSAAEIQFAGRDIAFYCYLKAASRQAAETALLGFYDLLDGLSGLAAFSTPYGTFQVYIKEKIEPLYRGNGLCIMEIKFREPNPNLSGGSIPASADPETVNGIDGIDFGTLGFTVIDFSHLGIRYLSLKGILDRAAPKGQSFTNYFKEGFQVTKPEAREYTLNAIIEVSTYSQLETIVKNLFALFSAPGTRVIYLKNDLIRLVFVRNGFKIKNIQKRTGEVSALLEIEFTEASESAEDENYLLLTDTVGNYVTTTAGQKIVVKL